jgi:hypothetical protein
MTISRQRLALFAVTKAMQDLGLDANYRSLKVNFESNASPYWFTGSHGAFAAATYYPFPDYCDVCLPVSRDADGVVKYFQWFRYNYDDIPLPTLPDLVIEAGELIACTVIEIGRICFEGCIRALIPPQ